MSERQNIEWKESWRDEYLKWICGFTNAEGGTLVIGKNDKGDIVGIGNSKKLMEDLPNKIKNMLGVLPEVNLRDKEDKKYVEIIVEPSKSPVSYKGRFYLRRGSTNQLLDGIALSNFILEKNNLHWDELPVTDATINDINEDTVSSFRKIAMIEGRIPSLTEETPTEIILKNLDLMNDKGQLTRAALILFGKKPMRVEFTAYLKIGKFGNSPTDLITQDQLELNAFDLAIRTLEILNSKYITRKISYDGSRRVEIPEYPFDALREILYNAIIHREYSSSPITVRVNPDNITVWNMGGLPSEITIEQLSEAHRSIPRNKLMANVFYMAGFIESWGRGTIKIIEECKKYDLPDPVIKEFQGGISVTMYKNRATKEFLETLNLNDRQRKAVEYLKDKKEITSGEYQALMETSDRTALRDLNELVDFGVVKKSGKNKGVKYFLI